MARDMDKKRQRDLLGELQAAADRITRADQDNVPPLTEDLQLVNAQSDDTLAAIGLLP